MQTAVELLEFARLEAAVRYGEQPDNPPLLNGYLTMSERIATDLLGSSGVRKLHLRVARVLLDTLCDTCVPRHWRCLCLDHIYRPLAAAERFVQTEVDKRQLRQLRQELNIMGNYFL